MHVREQVRVKVGFRSNLSRRSQVSRSRTSAGEKLCECRKIEVQVLYFKRIPHCTLKTSRSVRHVARCPLSYLARQINGKAT